MATKNISYNSLITHCMHRPLSTDGFILYPRIKGTNEVEGEDVTKAEQSAIYLKQSETYFNSPTNIRKVFITHDKVIVWYYAKMKAGTKEVDRIETRRIKIPDTNDGLMDIIKEMYSYEKNMNEYRAMKTISKTAKEPTRYNITGSVIGAISNPYVCNNIEEIYIDWTALMSDIAGSYFGNYLGLRDQMFLKNTAFKEIRDNTMLEYFKAFNSGGVKNLRNRFPRLRMIAMVSNLSDILKYSKNNSFDTNTWYDTNMELIKRSNSICLVSKLSDVKYPNKEFVIKDSQYKFDKEVLKYTIKKYIKSLEEKMLKANDNSETDVDESNVKPTEIEKLITVAEKKFGTDILQKALLAAASNRSDTEVKEEINKFNLKSNRVKVKALLGVKD